MHFYKNLTRKQKRGLNELIISLIAFILLGIASYWINSSVQTDHQAYIYLLIGYLVLYLYTARTVIMKTVSGILSFDFLDENFLMCVASLGAFILGEYTESIAVVWFYLLGEWFQSYALHQSRKNIASLMDLRPEIVHLEINGSIEDVEPEKAEKDQIMMIYPGERVGLDGIVLSGSSSLDTVALTGESVPRYVEAGSQVISGCVNGAGTLKVRITSSYNNSTVKRILDLVENATNQKSQSERFITKFARYYTPAVVGAAIIIALIPPLLGGNFQDWIYRALEFLVISCPCALVVSVPLGFFAGIGAAGKMGILFKGSNYLQNIQKIKVLVVDKTGTLTKGKFELINVQAYGLSQGELLKLAASVESISNHPIAKSICQAAGIFQKENVEAKEISGKGIEAEIDGKTVAVGNWKLMKDQGIDPEILPEPKEFASVVYVAIDGKLAGYLEIADEPKDNILTIMNLLKKQGVEKVVMLSGDKSSIAKAIAKLTGVDEVHAELLPDQKVEYLKKIMKENPDKITAYVGDGINDAPSLVTADIGIAMGSLGSDAAIESADVVLMNDQFDDLVSAFNLSRKVMSIVWFNIIFAISIKILFLILGLFGIASMWSAVFADVGVLVLCILNSIRVLNSRSLNVNLPKTALNPVS